GRGPDNDIVLDNDSISRRHCRIERRGAEWYVVDVGSTNGTMLNGMLFRGEARRLSRGDQIKVGDTIFKYLSGSDVEAQYHEAIHELAIKDGLTNVFNKRYLLETLEREVPRALRHQRPLSILMFDIDHFKRINDTYGHLAGDYVLREVATIVRKRLRPDDTFGRYGGEEFCAILPETSLSGASVIGEDLRRRIEAASFVFEGNQIPVTISIGGAQLVPGQDVMGLIKAADEKLYEAKRSGRNCVRV
ncbi:MAG: GGDEF domain-containing protein, partial [Deltaproteobacteria bacterium]|nr:GGDEF domain-containing protein [Deltaproteobacteria bacterium]